MERKTIVYFLLLSLLSKVLATYIEEMITLQSRTHLVCATDNTNSVIYVEPPIIQSRKNTSVLIEDDNLWEDWISAHSSQIKQEFVLELLDKRWEDFETIYSNSRVFNTVSSLSFSIYSFPVNKLEFHVGQNYRYFRKPRSREPWIHYSVLLKNKTVHLYENRQVFFSVKSDLKKLFIKIPNNTYWKIHDYPLRTANSISQSPTLLHTPSNLSCLIFYVLLQPHCIVDVYISDTLNHTFVSKKTSKMNHSWETHIFMLEHVRNITLVRRTSNGRSNGFWGLDIRKCDEIKSGKVVYEAVLEPQRGDENRTCKNLLEKSEVHSSMTIKPNANQIFRCNGTGKLGHYCDLMCEDLLGTTKRYCEQYRICEYFQDTSQCHCSWGFQGPSCDQQCADGTWGLSCKNNCNQSTKICDKRTGNCSRKKYSSTYFRLDCSPGNYKFLIHDEPEEAFESFDIFINNLACFNVTVNRNNNFTSVFKNGESVKNFPSGLNPTKVSVYPEANQSLQEKFIAPQFEIVVCAQNNVT